MSISIPDLFLFFSETMVTNIIIPGTAEQMKLQIVAKCLD